MNDSISPCSRSQVCSSTTGRADATAMACSAGKQCEVTSSTSYEQASPPSCAVVSAVSFQIRRHTPTRVPPSQMPTNILVCPDGNVAPLSPVSAALVSGQHSTAWEQSSASHDPPKPSIGSIERSEYQWLVWPAPAVGRAPTTKPWILPLASPTNTTANARSSSGTRSSMDRNADEGIAPEHITCGWGGLYEGAEEGPISSCIIEV